MLYTHLFAAARLPDRPAVAGGYGWLGPCDPVTSVATRLLTTLRSLGMAAASGAYPYNAAGVTPTPSPRGRPAAASRST